MNYFVALRLQALAAVEAPDQAAQLRSILRWYSKTFSTPLHVVEDLPIEDVLTVYYEDLYENLDDEARAREVDELLETEEQKRARLRAADEERADGFDFAQFTAEQERRKEARKMKDLKPEESRTFAKGKIPETSLPKPMATTPMGSLKELPPDIEMKFVSDADFEEELEGFGTMVPGVKPQSSK